jgi:glycosyltransferase involved in cell wall biosynthesis
LDSVYHQDIPEEDYEVICVNDASPDGSVDIVKRYQKEHSNLILVEHDYNKKLGAARNTGRKVASGKYIWNVDSDDMIAPNCLKNLLNLCEVNDLDVLLIKNKKIVNNQAQSVAQYLWNDTLVQSGIDFWISQAIPRLSAIGPVWMLILKKEYLDCHNIYSPEINMGEDVPYTIASILNSSKIKAINDELYIYRISEISMTEINYKRPSVEKIYEDSVISVGAIYQVYKEYKDYKDAKIAYSLMQIMRYMLSLNLQRIQALNRIQQKRLSKLYKSNFAKSNHMFAVFNKIDKLSFALYLITNKFRKIK